MKKSIKKITEFYGKKIAEFALKMGAIKLSIDKPFTWASGYKMPIYNDNRMFLSKSEYRKIISDAFVQMIEELGLKIDNIAGCATAGIPHATTLADRLALPLSYVRSSAKDHGMANQIEGLVNNSYEGKEVLLIEDLISTGGSSISAVNAVRNAHGNCTNCFAIFTYGFSKSTDAFLSLKPKCNLYTILDYDTMIQTALDIGYIDEKSKESLIEWRTSPFTWQDRFINKENQ